MYEINSGISLLSAIVTFSLGLYVYARNPNVLLNKAFFLLNFSQSIYAFGFYEIANSTASFFEFWLFVINTWPIILALLTHVVLIYTGDKTLFNNKVSITAFYMISIFIAVLFNTGVIEVSASMATWGIKLTVKPSPIFLIYIILLSIIGILVLFRLIVHSKNQETSTDRVKAIYVMIGFVLPWAAGFSSFFITVILKLDIPQLIIPSMAAEAVIISFAVIKYELFVLKPEAVSQEIVSNTTDAIILIDKKGIIIYVNNAACNMTGIEETGLIGLNIRDIITNEIAEKIINYANYGSKKNGCICESELKCIDSSSIPVSMTISVIKDTMNEVKGFVCIARDITDKYKLIEDIVEKEKTYKAIFNLSPSSIILLDKNGNILDISKRFLNLFRMERDDIIGKSISDMSFLPDTTKHLLYIKIAEISPENTYLRPFDIDFYNRNHESRIAEVYTSLLTDELNEKLGILAIVTDVTDKRLSDMKLLEAKEEITLALNREKELSDLKSRFISLISHEYRTPLTIILSSSSLIDRYFKLNDFQKMSEHIKKIQYAINSLVRMLENVVSVDTIGITRSQIKLSLIEVIGSIKSYINEVETVDNCMHPVEFFFSENKIIFDTDITLFRNIVFQLVSNSFKYSLPGKSVQVYLVNQENFLELTVSDQGIGIPPEYREHEYEPFFRCSNVGTISGIGLGLSIVKKSTDLLDGKVSYYSEINKGTTFTVILPKQYTMDYY